MKFALGLRGHLILLLLAAFAILAGLVSWDFASRREERIDAATAELLGQVRLIAARQHSIVAQADAILNGLMLSPELRPGAPAAICAQILATRLKQQPVFAQAGRMLPNGDVACAADPPKGRVNHADGAWFQAAFKSPEMAISDVMTGRILGQTGHRLRQDAARRGRARFGRLLPVAEPGMAAPRAGAGGGEEPDPGQWRHGESGKRSGQRKRVYGHASGSG